MEDPGIFKDCIIGFLKDRGASHGHEVLADMEVEAAERGFPIVGPEVGRFFYQLACIRKPKRILELGSGYGYSAVWWALAAGSDVEIHCTEFDENNIAKAKAYFARAGVGDRITYHQGDAVESAKGLEGPWDIVFCDIDKHGYPDAWRLMAPRMRSGDVILFDNALRHGRVTLTEDLDKSTKGVLELLDMAYGDESMMASLLPIRDGVLMALKK